MLLKRFSVTAGSGGGVSGNALVCMDQRVGDPSHISVNPSMVVRGTLVLIGIALLYSTCNAATTKPTIHKSTITTNIPIVQSIKFQRHPAVAIADNAVSGRLSLATKDLQTKDGASDVSCPVKLKLAGPVAAFPDPNPDSLLDIESTQEIADLFVAVDTNTHAALVRRILFCDGPTVAYGCTLGSLLMILSNDANTLWDQTTAAHEFGHFRGLGHVPSMANIMYAPIDTQGGSGNEDQVTAAQCDAFKKPL